MTKKHNNLGRIVHRASEEMYATQKIAEVTSWPEAINTFRAKLDIQVMNHNGYKESDAVKKRLLRKHETVLKYLENKFGDFYAAYDYRAPLPEVDPALENKIWMCWWQGLDNAPEIVKACVDSVRRNAGNREVIIITDKNVREYVSFPQCIRRRYNEGSLSKTHISDFLRLELLSRYGGLWLDATFFCAGSLDKSLYSAPLFSIKRPDYFHASVAGGMFANYSLGCDNEHRRVFATIRDYFLKYWEEEQFLVDYLLTDYLIVLAQRHDSYIDQAFKQIKPNNPMCDELFKVLDEPYDALKWKALTKDTDLFKLTWKQQFKTSSNHQDTFLGKIFKQ